MIQVIFTYAMLGGNWRNHHLLCKTRNIQVFLSQIWCNQLQTHQNHGLAPLTMFLLTHGLHTGLQVALVADPAQKFSGAIWMTARALLRQIWFFWNYFLQIWTNYTGSARAWQMRLIASAVQAWTRWSKPSFITANIMKATKQVKKVDLIVSFSKLLIFGI
jgi:hypothetical protein